MAWQGQGNLWAYVRPDRFPIKNAMNDPFPNLADFSRHDRAVNQDLAPGLERLPLDVILLICDVLPLSDHILVLLSTSHTLRGLILSFVDSLVYAQLKRSYRYLFPALPIKTPDGRRQQDELDWWAEQWKDCSQGRLSNAEDIRNHAPWLSYWKECTGNLKSEKDLGCGRTDTICVDS